MNLVPSTTLTLIHRSLRFSSFCHTIPFHQKVGSTPTIYESCISNSRGQRSRWAYCRRFWLSRLNFLFQLTGASFSTFRMIWALLVLGFDNVSILDLGFVTYQSIGFGAGAFFVTCLWWKQAEYLAFLNLLVSRSNKSPQDKNDNERDLFYRLAHWIIPAAYIQSLCNSFLFMRRKDGVQYVWSLLDPSWQNGGTFALVTIYEFLIPMNTWNAVLYMFFTYSSYTHYVGMHLQGWAKLERINPPTTRKSSLNCLLSYRKVQIVTNFYHSCYGGPIIPASLAILFFIISWMTFTTLRLAKSSVVSMTQPSFLIFPLGTFALFILGFCVNAEGQLLFVGSTQVLEEWKRSRVMRKMRIFQSLKPLKAHVGSLYYLKKISPLIFTSNVAGLTINLLLTF